MASSLHQAHKHRHEGDEEHRTWREREGGREGGREVRLRGKGSMCTGVVVVDLHDPKDH